MTPVEVAAQVAVDQFQPAVGKLVGEQAASEADFLIQRPPSPPSHATYGNTYGPLGITATRACGPYSANDSATACSTVGTGST